MNERIRVVKIGGNVVDDPEALQVFVKDFSRLAGPKILVHGGGKEATRVSGALGIETTMIEGRRVTDRATLDVVTMVYAGLINKRIVSMLQAVGVDAIGLSGADGNVIRAVKRTPNPIDYGYVGDIDPMDVNDIFLSMMLKGGLVPVICAITHDGDGTLLNCNADTIASSVAVASSRIAPVDLIYCFEKPGVLSDPDDDSSVIGFIDHETFENLKADGVVSKGMIPKISNALKAVDSGVTEVYIKSAANLLSAGGTLIARC